MNNLFDFKKEKAQKEIRKIIFEDEDDPFGVSLADVKSLERSAVVPSLEDGISTSNELKEGIRSEKVVHLVNPQGHNVFGKSESVSKANSSGSSLQSVITDVTEGKNRKKERPKEFWEMRTPEVTDEVKRELEILSMRGFWDQKAFFKGSRTKKELPKEFEFGTVIAGPLDSRKNRLTRKEKKLSFADELASDVGFKERSDILLEKERQKRTRPKHKKRH